MPKQRLQSKQAAESLGAYGGGWDVGTVLDISSAVQRHFTVDKDTNVLYIYTESDVYILLDNAETTANVTANDLILPAGLHSMSVPRGLYSNNNSRIYIHILQVTSAISKKLRVVEA